MSAHNQSNLTASLLQSQHVEASSSIEDENDEAMFSCAQIEGKQSEIYFCEDCGCSFANMKDYTAAHNGAPGTCNSDQRTEYIIEEIEDDETEIKVLDDEDLSDEEALVVAEKPLWELVDSETSLQMAADQSSNSSEKYFCYDCHSIFEDRHSAEEHTCPLAEESDPVLAQKIDSPVPPKKRAADVPSKSPSTCNICNTIFSSARGLKFHMRIHEKRAVKRIQDALPVGAHQQYNDLDQFHCEICNKSFDQHLLAVHKQMHQGKEQHMCSVCNRKFDSAIDYEMHMKLHDKVQEPTKLPSPSSEKPGFPCQYCGRVFSRPYEKVKHERVHTGEKPYSCEVCGKMFRVSYSLTLHLRTHTNIRPYVCTTCNKRFKSHQVYSHHLSSHSTERQYACDACGKAFRTSVQLYAHKNTHTKPFQCVICSRPFSSLYAVKAHMASHEKTGSEDGKGTSSGGSGKFSCVECGAEYARPFGLRLHMKSAHGLVMGSTIKLEDDRTVSEVEESDAAATDSETALLIAAAAADAAQVKEETCNIEDTGSSYEEIVEVPADALFNVDDFHSEEIITSW
ncbi:zinc finger protein 2 [Scaptodrosophila lebanonensis]|uniref:Zinc finger protein 2 n=1 Tax=Drosophila lebanonensis TaxID=7225 RepID=A0A6J2TGT7_DROLE|nr:zinc finger protein 2 [Scaptodrosophila lebanonensis]